MRKKDNITYTGLEPSTGFIHSPTPFSMYSKIWVALGHVELVPLEPSLCKDGFNPHNTNLEKITQETIYTNTLLYDIFCK
uniref:CRISPR-associated endonuclease Cas1 n=1 Tax=Strongyloides venezuelensis TaxID=75913 RepID=A0A0K0FVI7_STRVS